LKDGGEVVIDYMGDTFKEGEYFKQFKNPVLIIVPGIA